MAETIENWKNSLEKHRWMIVYIAALITAFFSLGGWALLPDKVLLIAESAGGTPMDKNMALLANLGVTTFFGALFCFRPREIVYFVALCLGVLLTTVPLLNLMAA